MEIRSLEIDIDRNTLNINGENVTDRPVLVTLPGPEPGWPYAKVFNSDRVTGHMEEHDLRNEIRKESEKMKRPVIKNTDEFKSLCMPIVRYLEENSDPYVEVYISSGLIRVTSDECGIPISCGQSK